VNNSWNLLWVFLIIVSVPPMIQKRLMEDRGRPSAQYIPVPYKKAERKPQEK
jgi:hypothetical protein